MLPAHLGLSYSNNYFDRIVDKEATQGLIYGGSSELEKNPDLCKPCRNFSIVLMILSILIAITFVSTYGYGLEFLGFVIFGNLLGWFYSAPPLRLSYQGLGEPANMITMGFLMPGIGFWVINGGINGSFLLFSIPLFLYGLQFILTVELPDYESDKKAGKKTLVVRKGRKYGVLLIVISTFGATLFYIIYALSQTISSEINPYYLTFFSLIPLIISIIGLQVNLKKKSTIQRLATANMASLIGFILLLNFYFVFLLL